MVDHLELHDAHDDGSTSSFVVLITCLACPDSQPTRDIIEQQTRDGMHQMPTWHVLDPSLCLARSGRHGGVDHMACPGSNDDIAHLACPGSNDAIACFAFPISEQQTRDGIHQMPPWHVLKPSLCLARDGHHDGGGLALAMACHWLPNNEVPRCGPQEQ